MVVLVSIGLLFTSCTKGEPTKEQKQTEQTSGKDGKEAAGKEEEKKEEEVGYSLPIVKEPLTLRFMKRDAEDPGCSFTTMKPLVWEEYEKKTGIHIEFDVAPNQEYPEKVKLRLAAKEDLPDIIEIPGGQEGTYLAQYLNDGVLIRLNEYIDKYGVYIKKIFEKYPGYKRNLTLPDGSIVGLGNVDTSKYQYMGPAIRKDWLDKLGLDMPKTLDDYYNVAKAFKEGDPNGNGKQDEVTMSSSDALFGFYQLGMAYGLFLCTGSGWSLRDGKVTYDWISPEAKEFLKFLNKLYKEGLMPADILTADYGKLHNARVLANQVGINPRVTAPSTISWAGKDHEIKKNTPEAVWVMAPPPAQPGYKPAVPKEPIAQRWRTVAITSACKHPAEAFKWLDWVIFSEEGSRLTLYGIEGKTYHMENGKPVLDTAQLNVPLDNNTWMGTGYVPAVTDDARIEAGFKLGGIDPNSEIVKAIKSAWDYVVEPFVLPIPTPEEGNELSSLLTEVKTYRDEMIQKFLIGSVSIDEKWDEYVENMKKIGLARMLEIYQKAYDRLPK